MLNKTYFYGLLLYLIFNSSSLRSECLPWCSGEWSNILREQNWSKQEKQIREFGKNFGYVICCCNLSKFKDTYNNGNIHIIPYFNEKVYDNICFDKKKNEIFIKLPLKDVPEGEDKLLEFDSIEFAFCNEWIDIGEYLFKDIKTSNFNILYRCIKIYFSFGESFCEGYNGLLQSLMEKGDDGVWNGLSEQIAELKEMLDSKAFLAKEDNRQLIKNLWENNGCLTSFKKAFQYIIDTDGEV